MTLYITKSISKFVTGLCSLLFIIILHMVMLDVLIHLRVKVTDRGSAPRMRKESYIQFNTRGLCNYVECSKSVKQTPHIYDYYGALQSVQSQILGRKLIS